MPPIRRLPVPPRPPARKVPLGVATLYPRKVRAPISFTAPPEQRRKLSALQKKTRRSRADVICWLIDRATDELMIGAMQHD